MKLSKLPLTIFILASIALLWWSFPIIKNRYFNTSNTPTDSNATPQQTGDQSQPNEINPSSDQSPITDASQSGAIPQTTLNQNELDNSFLHITPAVCDSRCKPFEEDAKELQYCQEICGLAPLSIPKSGTCDSLKMLIKDYCLKDLAISKKDFSICDQIQDGNIKKTCQNRITEDMLDQSFSQPAQ